MMNKRERLPSNANYREHRIRTSLQRHLGESTTDPAMIRALAAKALRDGVLVFLSTDLARLPWPEREVIERAAQRLYGSRRSSAEAG